MKKFNLKIFVIATVVTILLTFVSWAGLEANGMQNGSHTLWGTVGSLWTILRFPIFTFFWKFLYEKENILLMSTGVFINCAFYGFIVERIFSLRKKKSKIPPVSSGI
jgi:hypothetical protein